LPVRPVDAPAIPEGVFGAAINDTLFIFTQPESVPARTLTQNPFRSSTSTFEPFKRLATLAAAGLGSALSKPSADTVATSAVIATGAVSARDAVTTPAKNMFSIKKSPRLPPIDRPWL
jgi:hypothetical protein